MDKATFQRLDGWAKFALAREHARRHWKWAAIWTLVAMLSASAMVAVGTGAMLVGSKVSGQSARPILLAGQGLAALEVFARAAGRQEAVDELARAEAASKREGWKSAWVGDGFLEKELAGGLSIDAKGASARIARYPTMAGWNEEMSRLRGEARASLGAKQSCPWRAAVRNALPGGDVKELIEACQAAMGVRDVGGYLLGVAFAAGLFGLALSIMGDSQSMKERLMPEPRFSPWLQEQGSQALAAWERRVLARGNKGSTDAVGKARKRL